MEGDLSDGELCELSDISSGSDFFETLKKKFEIESRKHQKQGEFITRTLDI